MKEQTMKKQTTKITMTAIFTAIIVTLQLLGGGFKIGTVSFSLVLIPIVVGAMLIGVSGGIVLGGVFGVMTIVNALIGLDPFTGFLLQAGPWTAIWTVIVCMVKGVLAGLVPALIFKALKRKHKYMAVVLASATAPICNTGVFVLGALTVLADSISKQFVGDSTLIYFVLIGCAGVNFVVEFLLNIIVSPALHTFVNAVSKRKI